jgi:hypothetical protein
MIAIALLFVRMAVARLSQGLVFEQQNLAAAPLPMN